MGKLVVWGLGVFLLFSSSVFAQKYKFGKVSKEELQEKSYPLDSSANAAVLYESRKVDYIYNSQGFHLITEVFKRIKIYNKEGFDYATEEISLYKRNSDQEKVMSLKGITYSLVNGEIKETKLKKDGIFNSEVSEYFDEIKFTMPALQEGSVIEYKYRIESPFVANIDRVYLQHEIPAKKIEVVIKAPEYFNFKKFSTGYLPIDLEEVKYSDKFNYRTESRLIAGLNGGRVKGSSHVVEYQGTKYIINSEDVPALKLEPYSGNTQNYISSMVFELSFVSFPNSPIENFSTTWEAVTKTIYESSNFGGELKKSNYYEDDLNQLVSGISDPIKKTAAIYNFVKQKMNWNKVYSVSAAKGVKKAYKEGTGSSGDINLILTSMLSSANIDANPVIVSSSSKVISLFPTRNGFDYVITRVKLPNGNIFYLDATDKYGLPNILPDRVVRGRGRVIAKNGTSQALTFRPTKPSSNRYSIQCELNSEGEVNGKFSVHHLDYLAHGFRVRNGVKSDESNVKRLEKKYEINDLQNYKVSGVKEYGKGVNERFDFSLEDQSEVIEDEIFFSPLLFLRDKENVFKSDERIYPVDYGYPFSNKYMINIKVPEGYEVTEIPKSGSFSLPDNMGKFVYRSNVANGVIQLVVNETINNSMISAEDYFVLKEFYNQVIQKENEQVVLKKI